MLGPLIMSGNSNDDSETTMMEGVNFLQMFSQWNPANKTKLMVAGREISESDTGPLRIGAEEVECVEEFPYLGSIITASGRVDTEVERRITQASKAFGALRAAPYNNTDRTHAS